MARATYFSATTFLLATLVFLPALRSRAQNTQVGPIVIHEVKHDVSPAVRDMASSAQPRTGTPREAPVARPTGPARTSSQPDPVARVPAGLPVGVSTVLNFDGQSADGFVPPDTNGAV